MNAPLYAKRIWVEPKTVDQASSGAGVDRAHSGRVAAGDWDLRTVPVVSLPKVMICLRHWQDGLSWEDAGAYELMDKLIAERGPVDGCANHDQVIARYERLDAMFLDVKSAGGLKTETQLHGTAGDLEHDGVLIHVGRAGLPIFGQGGAHRFAMALVLNLSRIPAQLGAVHPSAINRWRTFA